MFIGTVIIVVVVSTGLVLLLRELEAQCKAGVSRVEAARRR